MIPTGKITIETLDGSRFHMEYYPSSTVKLSIQKNADDKDIVLTNNLLDRTNTLAIQSNHRYLN